MYRKKLMRVCLTGVMVVSIATANVAPVFAAEPVEKVNVTLDGIILREEGRNISPTIYINDMYKKYQDCGDLEVSHH